MKIFLGADHQGFYLKNQVFSYLEKRGFEVEDVSQKELNPDDDFPQIAQAVALKIIGGDDNDRAILICGSGQGMAIAANRFRGIRAIVATTSEDARFGRNDEDANVLSLPGRIFTNLSEKDAKKWQTIIDTFLDTKFAAAPRYIRRNRELDELA